ncbi:MAG: ABC transporter permease [Gammaproteobacteria bacterium]|nr:ABC transporter permease [Gammaproteobacteria bacterium]
MTTASGVRAQLPQALRLREAGVYYALLLLVVALAAVCAALGRPSYLSAVNLINILYQASPVALMGVAMTVVLITGNFDLSVASVAALAAAVQIGAVDAVGFWPALLLALAAAGAIGLLNGVMVQLVGINAFIVTLGTLTAVRGLVLIVTGGRSLMVQTPAALATMTTFESGRAGPFPYPILYMAAFTLLVWLVLHFTTIGRRTYAVGGNAEAARLCGIRVNAYRIGAFVLSGVAAGFAGVLYASRFGAMNPTALQGEELTVIAAAILGGTSLFGGAGSVLKTVAGALVLYTLTNGFNILNLGANYQGLIEGTVLIAAAAIYTIGGRGREKSSRRVLVPLRGRGSPANPVGPARSA